MSRGLALAVVMLTPIFTILLLCFMPWIIPWIREKRRERLERESGMQLETRITNISSNTFQETPNTDQTNSSIISEPQTSQDTINSKCDKPPSYESLFPT